AQIAQMVNQEAASRIAADDLERTTIRSPIDGVLQRVDPRPGELLGVGAPVARIVDLRRVEAPLRLPVSAAASVAVGDRAELVADSPAATRWDGRVVRIAPEADARTRTITVFVEVEQRIDYGADDPLAGARTLLLPGQFVIGRVYSGRSEPRVLVPRRALDSDRVMVVVREGEGWRVRARAVAPPRFIEAEFPTLDPDETQWAVIPAGLEDGERVVLAGRDELADGMAVRVGDARAARPANGDAPRAGP
ncbi:MAG: efflux RND transporter periplasmic adaptor subunit, partial [Phycisphaeraceae bacterium]|nr:efflux RND transporter periplasmic adaptor subunit [Phycisphaeraceae bacterium]